MAFLMPGIQLINSTLALSIYWMGAYLIDRAQAEEKFQLFSDMVVFSSYAIQVIMSFIMMVMIFVLLPRASVAAKRILEVLQTKPAILDGTQTDSTQPCKGKIEFVMSASGIRMRRKMS